MTFVGYDGTSDEMKLVKPGHSKSSFDRAQTASYEVQAIDVGYIYSVNVRIVSWLWIG